MHARNTLGIYNYKLIKERLHQVDGLPQQFALSAFLLCPSVWRACVLFCFPRTHTVSSRVCFLCWRSVARHRHGDVSRSNARTVWASSDRCPGWSRCLDRFVGLSYLVPVPLFQADGYATAAIWRNSFKREGASRRSACILSSYLTSVVFQCLLGRDS